MLGRRLKRKHGVKLGYLYHLFALGLAVYVPAALLEVDFPFIRELEATTLLLGAIFLIALVDRYVWELYFQQRHRVKVPKFLSEVVRLAIVLIAIFLVLDLCYGQTIKGLLIAPGIAATSLICLIFSWNEFFYAVNFTSSVAGTAPIFLVGFISGRGLFYAKLAAAATLASLPVLIAGWIAQKQLIRGLTMGAVK